MALNGKLDDLAPAEIFQLISLTRKSGKLLLTRGDQQGVVVFRDGKIVFAASDSLRSALGSALSGGTVGADQAFLAQTGGQDKASVTDSGSFMVEVRDERPGMLEEVVRQQIETIVRDMVQWNSGRFVFEPVILPKSEDITVESGWLDRGVDSEALVLHALTKLDEVERHQWQRDLADAAASADAAAPERRRKSEISAAFEVLVDEDTGEITWAPVRPPGASASRDLEHLRRIMSEMSEMKGMSPSLTADVTLLVLRYAAQLVNRGVLLAVRQESVRGIGQFGLRFRDETADERVRNLIVPLDYPSVFFDVVRTGRSFRGRLRDTAWNRYLVDQLGGVEPADVAVVPLLIEGAVVAIFYGDNLPDRSVIGTVDGLEILTHEIGLAVEKARLERRLRTLERNGG